MAQFTIYRSSDASAPTLSGTAGDLVNLLDKCLVTGYGSKTAAGWSKPFTGTNKAAFRMGAGNQFYLRVQDDAPGAHGAQEARLVGYEAMTDVDTGTGPFPTAAQKATGLFARKSAAASATTRSWVAAADDRTFYLFVQTGDVANQYSGIMFGDIWSVGSSDAYRTMIIARYTEAAALNLAEGMDYTTVGSMTGNFPGHYLARAYTGAGGSVNVAKYADESMVDYPANQAFFNSDLCYPNPSDGAVYASRWSIVDTNTGGFKTTRGRLRGFWALHHLPDSVADGETLVGNGAMAGYTFLAIKYSAVNAPFRCTYLVETSNTLETN
jgi:hypothetical protein